MKRILRLGKTFLLVVGLIMLFSGCGLVHRAQDALSIPAPDPTGLPLSTIQPVDIPVPDNFRHLPDESIYYVNGDLRNAVIKYVATASVVTDSVLKYYDKNMPLPDYGWTKISESGDVLGSPKMRFLEFEKRNELCRVIVSKPGPDETVLTIEIKPKASIK